MIENFGAFLFWSMIASAFLVAYWFCALMWFTILTDGEFFKKRQETRGWRFIAITTSAIPFLPLALWGIALVVLAALKGTVHFFRCLYLWVRDGGDTFYIFDER